MDEPESSRTASCEGDSEKRNAGTEKARPTAIVLFKSKKLLWAAFILIFCTRLFLLLVDGIVLSIVPQVMSDFSDPSRSVLSVVPMVIGISSGVLRLPMAKYLDRYGRVQAFSLAWVICQLGLLILTAATAPSSTVAGQIFYGIGSGCVDFVLTVVLADMTSLKNRALIYGIYVTPLILSTLAAPDLAQFLESRITWRGTLGCFCALTLCALSFLLSFILGEAQAKLWDKDEEGDTTTTTNTEEKPRVGDRQRRFVVELDIPGVILAMAGICLLLLAPSHFPGTQEGWSASIFSAVLVLGFFILTFLFAWEYYLAPVNCFPASLMRNRTLAGASGVAMLAAASIACWSSYYNSYLQVVLDQSIITAGLVTTVRTLALACSAPLVGLALRKTGNYRLPAVCAALYLASFTGFLVVDFRTTLGVTECLIFMGIIESTLIACCQIAVMASVDHENVAMALGIWGTFLSIGVAIGTTGATAIWTIGLPHFLSKALPVDSKNLTSELLGSLEIQKQYPLGGTIRDALEAAYVVAQQHVLAIATCLAALALLCAFLLKHIDLRERKDVQGARARGVIL